MSRVGKQVVPLPRDVNVSVDGDSVLVKGPKGSLKQDFFGRVLIDVQGASCKVSLAADQHPRYWGLYRTLLNNMVVGVSAGFEKKLELQGVGYRAALSGKSLNLTVGYSHPVVIDPPEGVSFTVDKSGVIIISGSDKAAVGQVAAKVRSVRPPEPYHGKGIRYSGEVILQKAGKAAGKK